LTFEDAKLRKLAENSDFWKLRKQYRTQNIKSRNSENYISFVFVTCSLSCESEERREDKAVDRRNIRVNP